MNTKVRFDTHTVEHIKARKMCEHAVVVKSILFRKKCNYPDRIQRNNSWAVISSFHVRPRTSLQSTVLIKGSDFTEPHCNIIKKNLAKHSIERKNNGSGRLEAFPPINGHFSISGKVLSKWRIYRS